MIDFSNIKAVIFDFDGTLYCKKHLALKLVFSAPVHTFKMKAERECRRELKGQYFGSEEAFTSEFINLLAQKNKIHFDKAAVWYKEVYLPFIIKTLQNNFKAFPGTEELFQTLRSKSVKTVVFSDYRCVDKRMLAIGLEPGIADKLYSAEELGGLKPAKEPFLQIAKELGIAPVNILVVGDRDDTDGEGARSAGMHFIQLQKNQSLATCFSQFLPC